LNVDRPLGERHPDVPVAESRQTVGSIVTLALAQRMNPSRGRGQNSIRVIHRMDKEIPATS
jgi:hypothetical protein